MYEGHLIRCSSRWMTHASAYGERPLLALPKGQLDGRTGDPVFLLEDDRPSSIIRFYAATAFCENVKLEWALKNWSKGLGVDSLRTFCEMFNFQEPNLRLELEVEFISMHNFTEVYPSMDLNDFGIMMPADEISKHCDAREVLDILKAIPPQIRTEWAEKIVSRNNELPQM